MAQANYNWPINQTTVNSGPIQFEINGTPTKVNVDTTTPANSTPLPVRLYDANGNILAFNNDYGAASGALRTASQIGNTTGAADFGAGNSSAQTLRTVLATNQSAIPIKPAPATGSAFSFNGLGQNAEITGLDGQETWDIYVSSIGVGGQIMVFGSPDPSSVALQSVPAVNLSTGVSSITIDSIGLYRVNIAGFYKVELEVTAYTSGTIAGIQLVSYNSSVVSLGSPLPSGTNIIGSVNQGSAPWSVSQSGTWNINNISGTVSLPTGAATEATLSTLNGKVANDFGVATGAIRTAAQIGSATGAADFNAGATSATTLRVEANQGAANATPWTVTATSLPLPTGAATETTLSALNTKVANDFGASSGAVRTAAQIGSATGAADFDAGGSTAQTLRVIPASDSLIGTKSPVNTEGSQSNTSLSGVTAATATAPANAVGFILQAPDSNTDTIRYRINQVASTTLGMQLQPGRDTGFIPAAANVSVCATASGTNAFEIQWILSQ